MSFSLASGVLVVIALAIGTLWAQPSHPPKLTVASVGEPRVHGSSIYVTAEVHNDGNETAQDVVVSASVVEDGERVPSGSQVVGFLAGGASTEVVFVIESRSELAGLRLRVEGYAVP